MEQQQQPVHYVPLHHMFGGPLVSEQFSDGHSLVRLLAKNPNSYLVWPGKNQNADWRMLYSYTDPVVSDKEASGKGFRCHKVWVAKKDLKLLDAIRFSHVRPILHKLVGKINNTGGAKTPEQSALILVSQPDGGESTWNTNIDIRLAAVRYIVRQYNYDGALVSIGWDNHPHTPEDVDKRQAVYVDSKTMWSVFETRALQGCKDIIEELNLYNTGDKSGVLRINARPCDGPLFGSKCIIKNPNVGMVAFRDLALAPMIRIPERFLFYKRTSTPFPAQNKKSDLINLLTALPTGSWVEKQVGWPKESVACITTHDLSAVDMRSLVDYEENSVQKCLESVFERSSKSGADTQKLWTDLREWANPIAHAIAMRYPIDRSTGESVDALFVLHPDDTYIANLGMAPGAEIKTGQNKTGDKLFEDIVSLLVKPEVKTKFAELENKLDLEAPDLAYETKGGEEDEIRPAEYTVTTRHAEDGVYMSETFEASELSLDEFFKEYGTDLEMSISKLFLEMIEMMVDIARQIARYAKENEKPSTAHEEVHDWMLKFQSKMLTTETTDEITSELHGRINDAIRSLPAGKRLEYFDKTLKSDIFQALVEQINASMNTVGPASPAVQKNLQSLVNFMTTNILAIVPYFGTEEVEEVLKQISVAGGLDDEREQSKTLEDIHTIASESIKLWEVSPAYTRNTTYGELYGTDPYMQHFLIIPKVVLDGEAQFSSGQAAPVRRKFIEHPLIVSFGSDAELPLIKTGDGKTRLLAEEFFHSAFAKWGGDQVELIPIGAPQVLFARAVALAQAILLPLKDADTQRISPAHSDDGSSENIVGYDLLFNAAPVDKFNGESLGSFLYDKFKARQNLSIFRLARWTDPVTQLKEAREITPEEEALVGTKNWAHLLSTILEPFMKLDPEPLHLAMIYTASQAFRGFGFTLDADDIGTSLLSQATANPEFKAIKSINFNTLIDVQAIRVYFMEDQEKLDAILNMKQ